MVLWLVPPSLLNKKVCVVQHFMSVKVYLFFKFSIIKEQTKEMLHHMCNAITVTTNKNLNNSVRQVEVRAAGVNINSM